MYQGKHYVENNKRNAKSIVLAIVAMIELLLLCVTMTFSWFEGTTALKITTDYENFPGLKTAKGLNSSFTVGGENSKYSNTAELNEYIEMQANAKFSPVSSYNGEDFFALMDGTAADGKAPDSYDDYLNGITTSDANSKLKFRQLSNEEKNSSLVYFQFKVTAATSDTTFWLKELPTFTVNGKVLESNNNPFRIRIDDGTGASSSEEHNLILSDKLTWPANGYYASGASRNNMLAVKSLKADNTAQLKLAADHLGNRANYKVFSKTSTQNKNGAEVLFTVPKGETKTITMAIWLEALDQSYSSTLIPAGATVDVDIQFCSSWDVIDTITFRDYTSQQWINDDSNKKNWLVNNTTGHGYEMSYTSNGTTTSTVSKNTWTVDVPRAVQDITFRCEDEAYDTDPPGEWIPAERGTNTTFTAFGKHAGLWYEGEVTRIALSDYTEGHWLNNNGEDGKSPKMKVSISYGEINLNYSMTDYPDADSEGKNTWFAYIPSNVNDVVFNRCDRTTESNVYNYWDAKLRNNETVYYALDKDVPTETNKTTIYLKVPTEYTFFDQDRLPAISLTSDYNIDYIKNELKGNLSGIHQGDPNRNIRGYYVGDDKDKADTWYQDQGRMTKISDGFYSFSFDFVLENGTYITIWNKPQVNYTNLDNQTRIAPAIQFDSNYNMLTLANPQKLTNGDFNEAYAFEGNWSLNSSGGDSSVTTNPKEQYGRWGKEELNVTGSYTTFFKHSKPATSVTAKFKYEGFYYTVSLTGSGYDWSTNKIPDSATELTFTDNNNSTWEVTSTRSSSKNCYYVFNTGHGQLNGEGYNRVYLTNNAGWSDAYVYSWVTGSDGSPAWPGSAMTYLYDSTNGSKIYAALVPSGNNIAFNNNDSGKQTNNIDARYVYDMCGFVLSGSTSPYEYLIYNASDGNYASANVPAGSYGTRFVHTGNASGVSATFTYNGVSYTVPFTVEEGKIWVTHAMPDSGVSNIVFKDSNGNTWSNTSGRSGDNKYYVTTSTTAGSWKSSAPAQEIVIYVDFSKAGSNWGSGHYLSVTSSTNAGKNMNSSDTSGAGTYTPKNDKWMGSGTHVSGSIYKWTIPEANVSNLKNYGFTVWSVDESTYSQVWQVDVSHKSYDASKNTYTISSGSERHNDRQADCFTLTASSNTN